MRQTCTLQASSAAAPQLHCGNLFLVYLAIPYMRKRYMYTAGYVQKVQVCLDPGIMGYVQII